MQPDLQAAQRLANVRHRLHVTIASGGLAPRGLRSSSGELGCLGGFELVLHAVAFAQRMTAGPAVESSV